MLLNQILLIPIIGSIIIALIPVQEMCETEAKSKLDKNRDLILKSLPSHFLVEQNSNQENETKIIDFIIKNENNNRTKTIKYIALTTSIINFIVSIYL